MTNKISIEILNWPKAKEAALFIRTEVFIKEQEVPEELEWDDEDLTCVHFIAYINNQAVGCARLLSDGHFGRVAVLKNHRRFGIATQLLKAIEDYAIEKTDLSNLEASAQISALPFYLQLGYEAFGEVYEEANIPHKHIVKDI